MLRIICLFVFYISSVVSQTNSFNYDDPSRWPIDFPTCGGIKQSPIAISSQKSFNVPLSPIFFGLYEEFLGDLLQVKNNGHSIDFQIPDTVQGERPFITGGIMQDIYEVQSVHFHWGSATKKGSEHTFDGRRYDMEMHIVHKNAKYATAEIAREQKDGFAVIGVFFKVARLPQVYFPGLEEIFNSLEHLVNFNTTTVTNKLITVGSLLGSIDRENYYTYKGSLTTPPCSEAVTWVVFPDPLPISFVELIKFWLVRDVRGLPLINNFRPLQSSESRKVYHRIPDVSYHF